MTALKTLTMRLRGTKTELEEAGLDADNMATSVSSLQKKLLALSHGQVDIMADANAFKNTTEILREMATAWQDMTDVERASALELMGGKRQANILSAIISNFDTVEAVVETSATSANSALEENEKYLDSIQGKIDLFTNAVQTMWNNLLDSDIIKAIISHGTKIIQSLDTIPGKISAILKLLAIFMAYKKINPLNWLVTTSQVIHADKIKNYILSLLGIVPAMKTVTAETVANTIAIELNDDAKIKNALESTKLSGVTGVLSLAQKKQALEALLAAQSTNGLTNAQIQNIAAIMGLGVAVDETTGKLVVMDTTTKSIMASNPIGWILAIISAVISLGFVIKQLIPTAKDLAKATKEVLDEYNNATKTLKSHYDTIEEISEDYAKLAKGVDNLGNNVSLSTEEYKKYNEITNKIADMFPTMVSGYTAEGNAIIAMKGNVDELTKAYEAEAQAARDAVLIKSEDIFDNFKNNTTDVGSWWEEKYNKLEDLKYIEDLLDGQLDKFEATDFGNITGLSRWFKAAGIEGLSFWDTVISTDPFADYMKILKDNLPQWQAYYRQLKTEIDTETANIKPIINAYLGNDFDYAQLSSDAKNTIQQIINEFDAEFYSQFDSASEMESWISANLIQPLKDATKVSEFKFAFDVQTQWNNNEISANEYQQQINDFLQLLKQLDFDEDIIKSVTILFNTDDITTKQNIVKELLSDEYDDMAGTLSQEDLDIVDKYKSEWQLDNGILYSWDELLQKIEQAKQIVDTSSITDSLSQIKFLEEAYDSLGDVIQKFKEDGFVDASTLESLDETFKDVDGFEELYQVLITGAGDVNQAISNVANAYITQKGILSDLSEDEKQIMIARLKSLGVINAEEVFQVKYKAQEELSMLGKQYSMDLSNYVTAEEAKLAIAQQLGLNVNTIQDDQIETLARQYGVDLSNYATVAEQKIAIAKAVAKATAESNAQEALSKLNPQYNDPAYREIRNTIYQEYQDAINAIPSDEIFNNIKSIVDGAYKALNFDFSGGKIGIGSHYDDLLGDTAAQKKIQDEWDKLINKYQNRIDLLQNEKDLIQSEIDQAEQRGEIASTEYYNRYIELEEQERNALKEKYKALRHYLNEHKDSIDSDTWTEYNNEINETVVAIQECTTNMIEFAKSINDINLESFEHITDEISDLTDEIDFLNELLEDADIADDNGNWSAAAMTRGMLVTNGMEVAATNAHRYREELQKLGPAYEAYKKLVENHLGDKDAISKKELEYLADTYGYVITSEQELQDETRRLTSAQRESIKDYKNYQDAIADMAQARVDKMKEAIEEEIDSYNDYIDVVRESLDAERDLYNFKKSLAKQSKDIAETERRIAALTGSTNAADIAERRKLEAQLAEQQESRNDTLYDHSQSALDDALDREQSAYEESMNRRIEALEKSLEDREQFIADFMMDVLLNADVSLLELNKTAETYGIDLSSRLTTPWQDASDKAIAFKNDLQNSMLSGDYATLIGEGGAVTLFSNSMAQKLQAPFGEATQKKIDELKNQVVAYSDFLNGEELKQKFDGAVTTFGNQIQTIIDKWNAVKKSADDAAQASMRAMTVPNTVGGNPDVWNTITGNGTNGGNDGGGEPKVVSGTDIKMLQTRHKKVFGPFLTIDAMYAKGTLGTKKDEWTVTDESWLGDEITLAAGKNGQLQYLKKGSAVMPADISANLVEWGKLNPNMMNLMNPTAGINMISNAINKPEFNFNVEKFLSIDKVDQDTLPEVKKFVQQELDNFVKKMNYSLKKMGAY